MQPHLLKHKKIFPQTFHDTIWDYVKIFKDVRKQSSLFLLECVKQYNSRVPKAYLLVQWDVTKSRAMRQLGSCLFNHH